MASRGLRPRRLRELRADALDARGASRLARGVASVAELTDLVNEAPLREQRWALLMTALLSRIARPRPCRRSSGRARRSRSSSASSRVRNSLLSNARSSTTTRDSTRTSGWAFVRRPRSSFSGGHASSSIRGNAARRSPRSKTPSPRRASVTAIRARSVRRASTSRSTPAPRRLAAGERCPRRCSPVRAL